tara:strand:+ start:519 stop:1568 length:1050 start_codon:yes stop_codon:yes gene_type:complete
MALNINGTTGISGVDGSASAPAVTGTDSNTGINFGSDTVNINTGGSTKASIDSAGALDVPSNFPIKVNGSEKLRIDSDGRFLLGTDTTAGGSKIQVFESTDGSMTLGSSSVSASGTASINLAPSNKITGAQIICTAEEDFSVSANRTARLGFFRRKDGTISEAMRIDSSGNKIMGIGKVDFTESGRKAYFTQNGVYVSGRFAGDNFVIFQAEDQSNQVGSISRTGFSTVYSTSSDYRLKENIVSLSDGITRLKALKPSRFNFISEPSITMDGFLAHEVSSTVPEAITGEKDAVITQEMLDAENVSGKVGDPIYQQIDQAKLVPLLTAALQEAVAKIEVLETKVAALEAA